MSEEIKLKPCPFCGGEAHFEIHGQWIGSGFYKEVFTGECTKCGGKSQTWTCREDAARAWNRPIEDTQAARIEELERLVDELRGELAQSDRVADKARIAELEDILVEILENAVVNGVYREKAKIILDKKAIDK